MNAHRYATNTLINILHTGVTFIIAYAMTPFLIRHLGTESYGVWVFLGIFSITGYFSLLDFGLQGAVIKYVAEFRAREEKEKLEGVVSTSLYFFLIIGLVAAGLLIVFNYLFLTRVFHLPPEQYALIRMLVTVLAASFLFQFPAIAFSAVIEGLQRYDYLRGISIFTTILANAAIVLFITQANGLPLVVVSTLAAALLMTLLYAWIVRKLLPDISIRITRLKRDVLRALFPLSAKLFASRIVGLVFNNTDKILIGIFLTVNNQTEYDVVNKTHIIILSLLSMFNQAALPAASELSAHGDSGRMQDLLLRSTKYASAAVLPALLFLFIFPSRFLAAWVGPNFADLGYLVQLYIVHFIFTMFVGVSSTMLVGVNRVGEVLKISLWAAVLNLGISIIGVQYYGIAGLVFGTAVSYTISSILYVFAANRIFSIRGKEFFRKTVMPVLFPAAICTMVLLLTKPFLTFTTLLPWLGVIILLYGLFLCVFFFTGISQDERKFFKTLLMRFRRNNEEVS